MIFGKNSTNASFGYPTSEDNNSGFSGYPFEVTNGESSTSAAQASGLELAGLSTAEIEDWWLAPRSNGGAWEYSGSTLLDYSCDGFTGAYGSQTGSTSGSDTGESHRRLWSVVSMTFNADNSRRCLSRLRRVHRTTGVRAGTRGTVRSRSSDGPIPPPHRPTSLPPPGHIRRSRTHPIPGTDTHVGS